MIPKEKADEICRKMLYEMEWNGNVPLLKKNAKQCALIAVDEILSETEERDGMRVINNPYWMEVRNEIEKL